MLGALFGLRGMLLAASIAFAGGGLLGAEIVWKLWDVSAQNQQITSLKTQIAARDAAAKQDAPRAAADAARLAKLEELARDVENKTGDGQCLSPADVDRLRSLWEH